MALTDNLAAYFKLDEASGNRVDSVAGITLTDNNTVTSAVGKVSNAAQFTSANSEYLSVTDSATMSSGDIDFEWAGWVYFDTDSANQNIFSKSDNATVDEYRLMFLTASKKLKFFANNQGVDQTTFTTLSTGTWYFFDCYHDATANTVNIAINNGSFDSAAAASGGIDTAFAFNFGANAGNTPFMNGRIDEVGFWKRKLTAAERTELYNSGNGFTYPFVKPAFFLMF